MEATLTDIQRRPGRVADAIRRQETVNLTERGERFAEIQPCIKGISGAEFMRRWQSRSRLGKPLADELANQLKQLDQAQ